MRYRATFSIQFYCRAAKQNKKGEAPIEMGVNFQGQRFFINLPRKAKPKTFPKGLNDYLNIIERRIRTFEQDCLDDGEAVTIESIKAFIRNGYQRPGKSISGLAEAFFLSVQHKVDMGKVSAGVYRKYQLVWEKFLEVCKVDIQQKATSIKPQDIRYFCEYLEANYENSSAAGMEQKLKTILSFGRDNGYLQVMPFQEKIRKIEKKIEIPTRAEFDRIKNLDLSYNQSLERVRDLWIFASGSGLAYCDCAALLPGDFSESEGMVYIKKPRGKTGIEYLSVLLPWALEVADKYNRKLPVISNQKVNAYLKVIATLAGVGINITFHKARHYYASTLLNDYHLSLETTGKALGHSRGGKITAHYAKLFDRTVLDEFKQSRL